METEVDDIKTPSRVQKFLCKKHLVYTITLLGQEIVCHADFSMSLWQINVPLVLKDIFLKKWAIPGLFFLLFSSFQFKTVDNK